MGIAAVGFAFGHPQHSIAARPTSNKRKTPSRATLNDVQSPLAMPTTPSPHPQTASAPTSRLRKRSSVGRPLTSASNLRGGIRTLGSTPESKFNNEHEGGIAEQSSLRELGPSTSEGASTFEYKGSENSPPTWLKRMSTLSSLKTGSTVPTTRPGSSLISYSNGSTAPILPSFVDSGTGTVSRNKLVKRTSSQKALYGNNALHSTLRRPATSHQRTATLQQLQSQDEEPSRPSFVASSIPANDPTENNQPYDESSQRWRPYFKSQAVGSVKDGSSRKRSANGVVSRNDAPKNIVPGIKELPTLLLATSISSGSSNEVVDDRASNISGLSRPFTPIGYDGLVSPSMDRTNLDVATDPVLNSRRSFSIGDMFPSPSPSTWRMPRSGSLRRSKPHSRNSVGRRITSTPQSTNERDAGTVHPQTSAGIRHENNDQDSTNPSVVLPVPDVVSRPGSSPLPPLNRLSSFEIELPGTVPPYPATPRPEDPPSPQDRSAFSSLSMSSPLGPPATKFRPHRFSSAPSDPGSTLLGSDNDNSRLMSGDEDDVDSRSETIYDSTRTGATGSSHSGIRRPPIDTIFDESPPPELTTKSKLVALQDMLHNDSFVEHDQPHTLLADEHDVSTPIRLTTLSKEPKGPTPVHGTKGTFLSPGTSSSPPAIPAKLEPPKLASPDLNDEQDDDLWKFDNAETFHENRRKAGDVSSDKEYDPQLGPLSKLSEVTRRRESPPASGGKTSKPNIFEWSEQPSTDRDSSKGDSPRPKTAVHGRQGKEMRGSRLNGRRGPSALHLRSQSVPVSKDMLGHRNHNNASKLDSWILGNKGPSEDWDGDFEFEEPSPGLKPETISSEHMRSSYSSGMLVPRSILERQASVHGQFGQVKELTLLVEELKRLQVQAAGQGIMEGQSAELWKEAEGIINLATLDDEEQELFPPRSPHSPSFDLDMFDEDSPSVRPRRKSVLSPQKDDRPSLVDDLSGSQPSSRPSQDLSGLETPPPASRPRKESSAKAKHVLESIYQQRSHYDPTLLDAPFAQKKLPFDTTSLKDLVTRAGVVTRALKEIVRRAENGPESPEPQPPTPRDPPFISQMFQQPPTSPTLSNLSRSPRSTQTPTTPKSPKTPKSQRSSPFLGGSIAGNDNNEINGRMKMMTVV